MSSNVTLSACVRQNLLTLQNTAALMSQTQNRLATGKKVNSALDNPQNFFTSSSLSARASDLSNLLDAMGTGIQTIQAANNGLTAITSLVTQLQATVTQARGDASTAAVTPGTASVSSGGNTSTSTNRTLSFDLGGGVTASIDTYNTGTGATPTTLNGAGANFGTDFTGGTITANGNNVTIRGDSAATATTLNGAGGTFGTYTGGTIAIDGNLITIADDSNAAAVESAIDAVLGAGYTVGDNGSGQITLSKADGTDINITGDNTLLTTIGFASGNQSSTNGTVAFDATAATVQADFQSAGISGLLVGVSGGQVNLTLTSGNDLTLAGNNTLLTAIGFATGNQSSNNGDPGIAGTPKTIDDLVAAINGNSQLAGKVKASNSTGELSLQNLTTGAISVTGFSSGGAVTGNSTDSASLAVGTGGGLSSTRQSLLNQFNNLRTQLDQSASDSGYNGINLLNGDKLTVKFNETGSSSIDVQAKDSSNNVLAINATNLGINSQTSTDFGSNTSLDALSVTLSTALTTLRTQASSLGSQLSVVQTRQDFTKSMVNTLQVGADNLVLADSNEEGANMLALQTRQQLSTTALSLSAQADQAVLRLFG
jgi:flagellin-like hook-associated protein FlgL